MSKIMSMHLGDIAYFLSPTEEDPPQLTRWRFRFVATWSLTKPNQSTLTLQALLPGIPPLPSFRAEVYVAPVSLTMSEEESKNTARFRHRYQADPIPVERKSKRVQVIQPNRYIGGVALLFSVFDGIWCHWVDNWIEEFWASRKWGMGCYCWLLKMTAFLSPDYVRKWCNMASKKLLNWPHIPLSLMDKIQTSKIFSRPVVVRTFKSKPKKISRYQLKYFFQISTERKSRNIRNVGSSDADEKADCLVVSLWRTISGVIAVHLLKRGGLDGIRIRTCRTYWRVYSIETRQIETDCTCRCEF